MCIRDRDFTLLGGRLSVTFEYYIQKTSDLLQSVNLPSTSGVSSYVIARALLKDAPVILLDEATASLDVDNETEIQKAISGLVKGKTVHIRNFIAFGQCGQRHLVTMPVITVIKLIWTVNTGTDRH